MSKISDWIAAFEASEANDKNGITEPDVKVPTVNADYACLAQGHPLGTETISDGTINTSDWMGHSLLEAKLCG